ncbi:DUF222 domain-containing protein [Nocardioides sp. SYSU DS0651]|uniref:HNH endonuclease signature motif containing protein n=1 Tax=Nocardioides sp. SYSU DS0651 TaxID=3415955 RepID=UPI003F4C9E87
MSSVPVLHPLTAVVERAAGLADVDWDGVEPSALPECAVALARTKAMLDAALLEVADRLQSSGAVTEQGWASAKDFLTHVTGGRKGAGGSLVRAAEQTRELPEVRDAARSGAVSQAQARVIAGRVATLPRVPELRSAAASRMLDLVATHRYDASDLERSFGAVVRELDPDGTLLGDDRDRPLRERGAHGARFLSFAEDTVGGVRVRGYASLEEAEWVKTCLMPLAAPRTTAPGACGGEPGTVGERDDQGRRVSRGCPDPVCAHDGKDPRDAGARMWDALVDACDRLSATDSLPHVHGSRARVMVTMDLDRLRAQVDDAQRAGLARPADGHLGSGAPLSATAVRRLACDAEVIPAVLGTAGQVLDVGRSRRLVTSAIFLALVLRDRHCAFPGCERLPIACDAHHVVHWADGGPTAVDNLVLLCRRHHTLVHQSPWTVAIDPDTRRPVWHPPPPVDDRDRFTFLPRSRPPDPPRHPLVA